MVCYLGVWQSATGKNLKGGVLETQKGGRVTTDTPPALNRRLAQILDNIVQMPGIRLF